MVPLVRVEEYLRFPPYQPGCVDELIGGDVVFSPFPTVLHARLPARLVTILRPLERTGYGIGIKFGCVLGRHSLMGPDVGATKEDRWKKTGDNYLIGAPELVLKSIHLRTVEH